MRSDSLTRWDVLKLLAVALMFIDHAGHFYFTDEQWLRGIGRACAPIFLILTGFAPRTRFSFFLLAWAAALSLFEWLWMGHFHTLNILWSIVLLKQLLEWLETSGRLKLRLHEWVIGALFMLIPTLPVLQYGSFAVLFGLAGYVFKHRTHYAALTPLRFLLLVTCIYAASVAPLSGFTAVTSLVMTFSLTGMLIVLQWFFTSPRATVPCPAFLAPLAQVVSRQTAAIYALHLMLLIGMTGIGT